MMLLHLDDSNEDVFGENDAYQSLMRQVAFAIYDRCHDKLSVVKASLSRRVGVVDGIALSYVTPTERFSERQNHQRHLETRLKRRRDDFAIIAATVGFATSALRGAAATMRHDCGAAAIARFVDAQRRMRDDERDILDDARRLGDALRRLRRDFDADGVDLRGRAARLDRAIAAGAATYHRNIQNNKLQIHFVGTWENSRAEQCKHALKNKEEEVVKKIEANVDAAMNETKIHSSWTAYLNDEILDLLDVIEKKSTRYEIDLSSRENAITRTKMAISKLEEQLQKMRTEYNQRMNEMDSWKAGDEPYRVVNAAKLAEVAAKTVQKWWVPSKNELIHEEHLDEFDG